MSKTKIGIFGVLVFATMMMLVPASLADIYASGKKDRDYDDKRGYDDRHDYSERHYIEDDYYYEDDSYKKKPAIVEITKELFVCDNIVNVTEENTFFNCEFNEFLFFPAPPESEQYVSCDMVECPGIDESDWSVQVAKDIAAARDLSSTVPTPVDLTKINFYVTEDELDDNLNNDGNGCRTAGFDDSLGYIAILSETTTVDYRICVLFEGECDGPIYPGEVKECTAKNFIHSGNFNTVNGND